MTPEDTQIFGPMQAGPEEGLLIVRSDEGAIEGIRWALYVFELPAAHAYGESGAYSVDVSRELRDMVVAAKMHPEEGRTKLQTAAGYWFRDRVERLTNPEEAPPDEPQADAGVDAAEGEASTGGSEADAE